MNLELLTSRLRLTPLAVDDVDLALQMFTDPEVVKYVCDLMSEREIREEMANWLRRGDDGRLGIWCISNRRTNEKYGSVFLMPIPIEGDDTDYSLLVPEQKPDGEIEIGFSLKRSAWGKGVATEACRRLLRFGFEEAGLDEIVATLDEENSRSRNVLEKAGLTQVGTRRAYGRRRPDFRISRDQWSDSASDVAGCRLTK